MTKKIDIQQYLKDSYTDFDIIRENPLEFPVTGGSIVVAPVKYIDHPDFIEQMGFLFTRYCWFFDQITLLSTKDLREQAAIDDAVAALSLFKVGEEYRSVIADIEEFILRWGIFNGTDSGSIQSAEDKKSLLRQFNIDELLKILLLLITFNYDIVKKNLVECRQAITELFSIATGTSSSASRNVSAWTFDPSRYSRLDSIVSEPQSSPNPNAGE